MYETEYDVIFESEEHEKRFYALLSKMKSKDGYHREMAYLLTLNGMYEHIHLLFDLEQDGIKREGLSDPFQISASGRITRLAFNLWNSCGGYGYPETLSVYFTPDHIFGYSPELDTLLFQAIKLWCIR